MFALWLHFYYSKPKMTDYKADLYQSYVTTHTAHRKGAGSVADFTNRTFIYDQQLGRFLPENKAAKILDVGCGNGSIVWWLQQRGYTAAAGIDISQEQIAIGQELGVQNLVCGDLIPFLQKHAGTYGFIIARDVLEHFTKTEVVQIVQSINTALAPSGHLLIHVPNGESPFGGRVRYGDFTHELAFTTNTVTQLGKEYGFAAVQVYPSFFYGRGLRELGRKWLWALLQRYYKTLLFIETGKNPYIVTQNLLALFTKSGADDRHA
jgi:2-polyprenyl-3-methyl-5-hydroxy-6-metoxy-1,4-benzoquinol methylase